MTLNDAQYEWNPTYLPPRGNTQVGDVVVYSRSERLAGIRRYPDLQFWNCMNRRAKELNDLEALAFLLVDFHTMVVRDGIDPQTAHREFLKIDEYRRFISPDCDGAE